MEDLTMSSFNKVIILGNLTRDPELRYTPKGTAIAKLGLAINRVWTNEAGEKKEEVTFVDVDCFGRTAENAGQYLKKGRPIHVEGRLKLDTWDDKQTGQKRQRLGVIAEHIIFLGGNPDSAIGNRPSPSENSPNPADQTANQKLAEAPQPGPTDPDDVPF